MKLAMRDGKDEPAPARQSTQRRRKWRSGKQAHVPQALQATLSISSRYVVIVVCSRRATLTDRLAGDRSGALTMSFSNDGSWLAVACECHDGRYGIRCVQLGCIDCAGFDCAVTSQGIRYQYWHRQDSG